MKKPTATLTAFALLLSMTALSAGASTAMIKSNKGGIKVDARGINLADEQGQEILYSRLQRAAKQMCGSTSLQAVGSLQRAAANRQCVDETLTRAVESVGNSELTEFHKTS